MTSPPECPATVNTRRGWAWVFRRLHHRPIIDPLDKMTTGAKIRPQLPSQQLGNRQKYKSRIMRVLWKIKPNLKRFSMPVVMHGSIAYAR